MLTCSICNATAESDPRAEWKRFIGWQVCPACQAAKRLTKMEDVPALVRKMRDGDLKGK